MVSISTSLAEPTPPDEVTNPVVEAYGLRKIYGTGSAQVVALNDLFVAIGRGQFTAIMGASGSGKSTLMHCLAGLDRPTAGTIILEGRDITALSEKQLTLVRRESIGFIFQAFNLVPTLSAAENIVLPASIGGKTVSAERFDSIVEAVNASSYISRRPGELSGGQQQRVAVARAMVTSPSVIFADEPTGNLDSISGDQVLTLLRQAVDSFDQTVVMVTHDPYAAAFADRVIFLEDGAIVGELHDPTPQSTFDALAALGGLEGTEAIEQPEVEEPTLEVEEERPQSVGSPAVPLRPETEDVVDQARQILDALGGSIIDPNPTGDIDASYPQTSSERETLES